jgi:hypothetical protein
VQGYRRPSRIISRGGGHLPFPFGRETYGYEVADLAATLAKATAADATVLVDPFGTDDREAAMVQFPGGYNAEIHGFTAINRVAARPVLSRQPDSAAMILEYAPLA